MTARQLFLKMLERAISDYERDSRKIVGVTLLIRDNKSEHTYNWNGEKLLKERK